MSDDVTSAQTDLESLAKDWWHEAYTLNEQVRLERARDEDYYDGIQWTDAEIAELTARGQAPLVINVCAPVVNWLCGTERRTRVDFKVVPRSTDDADATAALAKTNLMKYIYTDNYVRSENSCVFKDGVTSGEGWVEVCFSSEDTDNPIRVRREDWRNIWFDYRSVSRTIDDARYLFRSKMVDLDIAISMYPEHKETLNNMATTDNTIFNATDPSHNTLAAAYGGGLTTVTLQRPMVRLIEGWFRLPEHSDKIVGGTFDGYYVDQVDGTVRELLDIELEEGIAEIENVYTRRVRTAIFVSSTDTSKPDIIMLKEEPSPYKHNRFPFVPFFTYRRRRDNTPYGVIRMALGAQDDLNKRRSKAIHILSTNKVIADADAMTPEGWKNAEDELPRPDAIIKLDGRRNARFEIHNEASLADSHLRLMQEDKDAIFLTTGVNSETVGGGNPYSSSKAILARQDQSTVVTTEVFDNYQLFLQQEGELILSLAEQAYVDEEVIRVKSDGGGWTYITINEDIGDDVLNDISNTRHDFVLAAEDYRDTLRQAMFEKMLELMGQLPPNVSMAMLDLIVDMSDIPNKKVIVDRIRAITRQEPPADESTPDDREAAAAREEARMREQQKADMLDEANIRIQNAEAARKEADAEWKRVKAEHTREAARKTKVDIAAAMGILPD